jgi:hypothetical protein
VPAVPIQQHDGIATLVEPAIDVPNAFLPLSVAPMQWCTPVASALPRCASVSGTAGGQKVFETNDRKIGWDGTWQGKLQPMDVYAYTLEVTFVDAARRPGKAI